MKPWTVIGILSSLIINHEAFAARFVPKSFLSTPSSSLQQAETANVRHENACAAEVSAFELAHGIPQNLLHAIAKVESGRKLDSNELVAWPWSINVEGQGFVYETKAEAIQAVKKFQNQGRRSIDVGCMQVNLLHHPNAFANLDSAFDPKKNVAYAAQYLQSLYKDSGNWHTAVAHYHSRNPIHHVPYHGKVMAMWDTRALPPNPKVSPRFATWKSVKPKTIRVQSNDSGKVVMTSAPSTVRRIKQGSSVKIVPASTKSMKVTAIKRIR